MSPVTGLRVSTNLLLGDYITGRQKKKGERYGPTGDRPDHDREVTIVGIPHVPLGSGGITKILQSRTKAGDASEAERTTAKAAAARLEKEANVM